MTEPLAPAAPQPGSGPLAGLAGGGVPALLILAGLCAALLLVSMGRRRHP